MVKDYTKTLMPTDEELEFEKLMAQEGAGEIGPTLSVGEMVTGRIVSMSRDVAFIDLGGKAEGVIDLSELDELDVEVGSEIEALVLQLGSEIRLSRTLASAARDKELLADAKRMGLPVEAKITGRNKGGFELTVAGLSAFMPVSHLAIESIEDLDAWIGRTERVLILEYDPPRKFLVSRAQLQRREREELAEKLWEEIAVDQVRTGTVRSIQDYGCFVDIGGADGLLHVREMAWSRLSHPSELVATGDEVCVTVVEVDHEKKRIGLSMKSAEADPWKRLGTDIKEGEILDGEVTRVERYGAFVELLPGLEGLVHVSEITHLKHVRHPNELLTPGDKVKVAIQQINHVERRVGLSMKTVEGDPWKDAATDYPIGASVTGTVERVAPFGVFVMVGPGVTALLPGSETDTPHGADLGRHYRPGDTVQATVLSVDPDDRRMSLSTKAAGEAQEARDVDSWQKKQQGSSGMGTFADLLKDVKLD